MIHTASLVHDDVLDDCSVRRGAHGCMAAWASLSGAACSSASMHAQPSVSAGASLALQLPHACGDARWPHKRCAHSTTCKLLLTPLLALSGKNTINSAVHNVFVIIALITLTCPLIKPQPPQARTP